MGIDPFIKHEIDRSLGKDEHARINNINRWGPPKRAPEKTEAEKLKSLANSRAGRLRAKDEATKKLSQVLDYYAGTAVPFDRIAQHTKLDAESVTKEMRARGRLS